MPVSRTLRSLLPLLLLALPLLGGRCSQIEIVFGVPQIGGNLPVEIQLQAGQDPATATVHLDGADVTALFTGSGATLQGAVPLPPPGTSTLLVSAISPSAVPGLGYRVQVEAPLLSPAAAPALAGFDPAPVAGALPRTAWLRLRFASPPAPPALDGPAFGIECDGAAVQRRAHLVDGAAVLLDPQPALPASASCRVAWRGPDGSVQEATFSTAAEAATPALVLHDRDDPSLVAPFPDDYFAVSDAGTRTGLRLSIPEPPYTGTLLQVYQGLLAPANVLDGFSRIPMIMVAFSHPIDASLAPADAFAAEDPFAPIALFDVDPTSPDYGQRIPYLVKLRTDANHSAQVDYSAAIFPSIALRPRGQYALVLTRRLFATATPGRSLSPSSFFTRAAGPSLAGETAAVARARSSIRSVLDFLETAPAVPIAREDVALAIRISVRSDDDIPNDLLAIKEDALAGPPPALTITNVQSRTDGGAILSGTVALPSYLDPLYQWFARNPEGRPQRMGSENVPFVLRLPPSSAPSPAPIVLYQHGNPGSPNEISSNSLNGYLANAGFAIGGIQDTINRRFGDVSTQVSATFFFLLQTHAIPAWWNQTGSDMIHFLRALQGLGGTAWRPANAPQAPLLDPTRLFYHGISEGGNNALRFLPYAQELIAATPTVGGGRLTETMLHQFPGLLSDLESFIGAVRPVQTLVGLSLFQHAFDEQDPHSFARFVYQAPLTIQGLPGGRSPSVLWTEGIGDTFVPNDATRSAARELGIPTVRKVRRASPFLTEVDAPLRANIAPDRTAGHFQFDPATTTPGCTAFTEGHFCPQTAPPAQQQRLHFFQSALTGLAPEIVDPLP